METGLLNFHDEETFATSIYDQGDFSGVDGQSSILDMMHSDLQYSSDYLNQSAVQWDSDQEQEHNGDLAVLPVAPSECSSLNSSKEDYHKSLFEWQDSLLPYQQLDPDVDLRLDGQGVTSELPDNIFEDSFESNSSVASSLHKSSLPGPLPTPARCSTPIPSLKESTVSSDASLNLDMSLSGLDVNVSDIDVSALGINVSSLEIKTDIGDVDAKPQAVTGAIIQPESSVSSSSKIIKTEGPPLPLTLHEAKSELNPDHEFTAWFGVPEGRAPFQTAESNSLLQSLPVLDVPQLPICKLENSDVEQLHDLAMEFIKEEQEAQAWSNLPPLNCNVHLDSLDSEVPVLEAGNLESLLEQFEATLKPVPEFSQSMPASPAHFPFPSSPLSMPASPSCITQSSLSTPACKTSPLPSPLSSPSKSKLEASTPKKSSPVTKGVSVLHQNILESIPAEIMDRIKASGRKKTIPLIPAMPSKRPSRSGTRMHAAAATLSRNKLLKLVSRKDSGGENVQFDHDYCSNESSSNVEFVPEKLVMDIKASTKQMEWDEDKLCRKDSGLESGDVSEDSEGAAIPSGTSSGYDSSSGSRSNYNSILKPRTANQPGRNKEMLMVSVLKKVRCETLQLPLKSSAVNKSKEILKTTNTGCAKNTSSIMKPCSSLAEIEAPPKPALNLAKPVQSSADVAKISVKAMEIPVKTMEAAAVCSNRVSKQSTVVSIKATATTVKLTDTVAVKAEPFETLQPSVVPSAIDKTKSAEVDVSLQPPEQPKKRKLNFEEYRNRQRAMEQKRESKSDVGSPKVKALLGNEANAGKTMPLNIMKEESESVLEKVKEEKNEVQICDPAVMGNLPPVVKDEKNVEPLLNAFLSNTPVVIKVEKNAEPISKTSVLNNAASTIKEEKNLEPLSEVIILPDENDDSVPKPVEERRKQRQYRTRHTSTSSSEGSPTKSLIKSSRRENRPKKATWSPSRSRSPSVSVTSSHSRSASSDSGSHRSSSSSSSSRCSCSSIESVQSSGRRRKSRRSRRRSSCSRSRSSSRSSSTSSRRSNSISSGSSRRSSRRSSRSRRRSRSRSVRRSRRDRSTSSSSSTSGSIGRGRGSGRRGDRQRSSGRSGWKRWRRHSNRSRGSSSLRRERSRSRNKRGDSWSSYVSRSDRSRSRSSCRQRHTPWSRSRPRSRAGRRFCYYSSQSESRSWSRSRSSQSRSYSSSRDRCQTRSRSRSRGKNRTQGKKQRRGKRTERKSWRSRSPMRRNVNWSRVEKEHKREVEERRVIYVGRIPEDTTKAELKRRFEVYGPILDISLHFREHADNYGFVTFAYKVDAYEAVERGNDDPTQPHYELCFGGRRKFCRERYADLDGMACKSNLGKIPHVNRTSEANSFDDMLREVQAKLQARKKL